MHCPLSALLLDCVLRICCQRRLTRWWSGPLGVRSSGWTGTSSVALSRPHPGTTLSSSCSLPCSLKGSVPSAGMCAQWHTQDQCTWCGSQCGITLFFFPSVASHVLKLMRCMEVHPQWKSLWAVKSDAHTQTASHRPKCPQLIFQPPSTYRPAHLKKHGKQHYITRTCGSHWHLYQRDSGQICYQRGMNKFHR